MAYTLNANAIRISVYKHGSRSGCGCTRVSFTRHHDRTLLLTNEMKSESFIHPDDVISVISTRHSISMCHMILTSKFPTHPCSQVCCSPRPRLSEKYDIYDTANKNNLTLLLFIVKHNWKIILSACEAHKFCSRSKHEYLM